MLGALFCLIVLIPLSIIIYDRVRYRKLYAMISKFPGPRYHIPILGEALNFRTIYVFIGSFLKYFRVYGATFAFWIFRVPIVVISDPKHLKIILNTDSCLDKEKRYHLGRETFGNGLLVAPAQLWKKNRKIINPTFSPKILNSFVDIFVKHTDLMMEEMENDIPEHKLFDIEHVVLKYMKDIVLETAMGIHKDLPLPFEYLHDMNRIAEIIVQRTVQVWLHPDFIFNLSPVGREFMRLNKKLNAYAVTLVEKKYRDLQSQDKDEVFLDDNKTKIFLDHLMSAGKDFSTQDLINEVKVFFGAGVDTSSNTLGYLFVFLGIYKDIQEKVAEEILDVFGESDRPICVEDLSKLPYLERAIKETLRMFPTVPFIGRNVNEDTDIGDYIIPKGASIMVAIALTHRNEQLWPNPLKFDPDRFLPSEVAKRHPYSYLPFSAGPRNCIGKYYAMMIMKIMAVSILRKFKVDTNMKVEKIRSYVQIVAKIVGGAKVSIEKRYNN